MIISSRKQIKITNPLSNFDNFFYQSTGHALYNFNGITNFIKWLHFDVDSAALGVFRILYGAAMLLDVAEERGGGRLDNRFGRPQHCHFPLFHFIKALDYPSMCCLYMSMWLGALGIMLGYRFHGSCLAYIIPYWYIFLLDKPSWNNHSYLFGLVGSILFFTKANHYCSLDKYLNPALSETIPYWNYFLIKFQFFLLYMYAGMKKFTAEWLSGYAMNSLSRHWLFTPLRYILSAEITDLLVVHWFTALFDFSIPFLMTCKKTRLFATPFMLIFHLMNTILFSIGMFPWVCLAETLLFFDCGMPRRITLKFKNIRKEIVKPKINNEIAESLTVPKLSHKLRTLLILIYCTLQLFLPYSHFITKGYNNWTNGLYGYSWDMMVHSYETTLISIKIVDNSNGEHQYLNPYAFTEYDRWTKCSDMAWQYAHCIKANIDAEFQRINHNIDKPLSSNISIYFDIWCSMNGRFQQRVFDPRVDLLHAYWSPFEYTNWSLPLLNELDHMRPKLFSQTNEVLSWNNFTDVSFVADLPGLTLHNYISDDLTNITLSVLVGSVLYESDNPSEKYLMSCETKSLPVSTSHRITTLGTGPSSLMYVFTNKTMIIKNISVDNDTDPVARSNLLLSFWNEIDERLQNYQRFLNHIINCFLFVFYKVPIPIEVQ